MEPQARSARPFVGREREVDEIGRALDRALAGAGQLILLAGEPGIGKTRLSDETSALAAGRGALVLWGRCWEAGGAPAYWPWMDVLSGLARAVDDSCLREVLGEGMGLLAEVLPELRPRLGELPAMAPPTPAEARFRLWRAVSMLARRVADRSGLMLVLDDLHAADEPSLMLLHFLARDLRGMRAFVLATYRDVEARLEPACGELLAKIGREGTTLSLARLDRGASDAFIRQRAARVEPDVEARIFSSTQGNPLFLEEMARLLGEEGPGAITAGTVPHGVREVIRQRLERVPSEARPLLDLAAVAGDEIDVGLVAMASGRPLSEVTATLAGAVRAGVLADRGERRLRFAHALIREVLYRLLAPEVRRGLHGQVAAALERFHADRPSLPLTELAHHALEGPTEGLGRAVAFAVRASARALEMVAYEEAVALLERAAAVTDDAGPERASVLLALADAVIRKGEVARGKTLCREVASLGRSLGVPDLMGQAALTYGQVFTSAMIDPVLVSLLEEALAALPPGDSSVRVRLMARLGAALQPTQDMSEPVRVARDAIAAARRLGDESTLLGALHAGMSAMMDVVDARERLPLNLETEQLAIKLKDRERLLRTRARIVMDHMALGEFAAADARIDEFESTAREMRAPGYLWRVPMFRSMRAMMQGRFADSEAFIEEGLRLGREANDEEVERCYLLHREGLLRAREGHSDMLAFDPVVRRTRGLLRFGPAWQAGALSLMHARREDVEAARQSLERVPVADRPPTYNAYSIFFFVDAAAIVRDRALATRMYDMISSEGDSDVTLGLSAVLWEGPVARLLALLAVGAGQTEQAIAHFEQAIARLERQGGGPYLARTRYEFARALTETGQGERARVLLGAARVDAERFGLPGLLTLIDARLGTAMALPASSAPFSLTPEGEYWSVSHEGQTFRLKDSLGIRYLARLVGEPDREWHVLELTGGTEAVDGGDSGELLDEGARDSYRGRLEDLRESLTEAESFGDRARAARIREEIEFLGAELGRAVGLGGRARRAGGAAERARSAVQRRIKNALARIEDHSPPLAAYLGRTVRTGTFCVYRPG